MITTHPFGTTTDGHAVTAWHITNQKGASATVLDYGATLQALCIPTLSGPVVDVVLGYDSIEEYQTNTCYLGATVGRVCNRIGGARFSLNGTAYPLAPNDGENHLHGGRLGFDRQLWQVVAEGDTLRCFRLSPDGEEGYPGNLSVQVSYTLTEKNTLHIVYGAHSDRDTLVSLTNHSYFNLAGHGSVLAHTLSIFAQRITENGTNSIPTGRMLEVAGTPFDFRRPKAIGQDIHADHPQLCVGHGYDHNFVLSGPQAAVLRCEETGLELRVETDLPGLQLYTANFLDKCPGKGGILMGPHGAVCLETQLFPDAMAHYGFPSPVLRAGEYMHSATTFSFQSF